MVKGAGPASSDGILASRPKRTEAAKEVGAKGVSFALAIRALIIAAIVWGLPALASLHAGADDRVSPVTPAVDRYVYRQPVTEDDGWRTASPQQAGLDPKPLAALVQQVLDTKTDSFKTPYIQSILVARHGKLVELMRSHLDARP